MTDKKDYECVKHGDNQILRYCIEIKCLDCGQIIGRREIEKVIVKHDLIQLVANQETKDYEIEYDED